jgi:hypothetical protein
VGRKTRVEGDIGEGRSQPLGKGAVSGEKAARGEEFVVRLPALKAARAAAAACASRQPLGKGAIGGEKAARGEEFGVRLPALKAACGGGSRT